MKSLLHTTIQIDPHSKHDTHSHHSANANIASRERKHLSPKVFSNSSPEEEGEAAAAAAAAAEAEQRSESGEK